MDRYIDYLMQLLDRTVIAFFTHIPESLAVITTVIIVTFLFTAAVGFIIIVVMGYIEDKIKEFKKGDKLWKA